MSLALDNLKFVNVYKNKTLGWVYKSCLFIFKETIFLKNVINLVGEICKTHLLLFDIKNFTTPAIFIFLYRLNFPIKHRLFVLHNISYF